MAAAWRSRSARRSSTHWRRRAGSEARSWWGVWSDASRAAASGTGGSSARLGSLRAGGRPPGEGHQCPWHPPRVDEPRPARAVAPRAGLPALAGDQRAGPGGLRSLETSARRNLGGGSSSHRDRQLDSRVADVWQPLLSRCADAAETHRRGVCGLASWVEETSELASSHRGSRLLSGRDRRMRRREGVRVAAVVRARANRFPTPGGA